MKTDSVCVKRRNGSLVGTGTLFLDCGKLELRTVPQTGTKYMHMAKQAAKTAADAAGVVAENVADDPLGAAGFVALPIVKSIWGSLTHTNLSRMRTETDFGRSLKNDLGSNVNVKDITNCKEITACLWYCQISEITGVQLNNNQLLIVKSASSFILEFPSMNKAKKFYDEIRGLG